MLTISLFMICCVPKKRSSVVILYLVDSTGYSVFSNVLLILVARKIMRVNCNVYNSMHMYQRRYRLYFLVRNLN